VAGPGAERATVAWALADGDDAVAFEIEPAVAGVAEKDPAPQPVS
jgi:hypothetical protein